MVLDREFPPDIRVENEIDALCKAGHQVHIACYTRKNKPGLEVLGDFTIHRKSVSSFIYKSSVASLVFPAYFRYWRRFMEEILSNREFDAIHVHDLPLARVGASVINKFGQSLVLDLHENWPAYLAISKHTNTLLGKLVSPIFMWRAYEKKVLKSADAVIVVVDEARERLTNLGIPKEKIHVVSNTINLSEVKLSSHQNHGNDIILYYAGGINYHRGLQQVIKAIHLAGNPLLKFWILGEGSYKNELAALIKKYSLQDQVIFKGYQSFQVVMEMMSQADYTLIPHLKTEHTDSTIPHKLFQYMFAQKPVIASDCKPIKRIIEETGAGMIYPSDQPEQLAVLLKNIGSVNPVEMGMNGRKWVETKYNWQYDARRLEMVYNGLKTRRQ